jgi:hypothetical protein
MQDDNRHIRSPATEDRPDGLARQTPIEVPADLIKNHLSLG